MTRKNAESFRCRRQPLGWTQTSPTAPKPRPPCSKPPGFGRLDTLVNNAGLMLLGPIAGADAEEWDRMIAINVKGLLYTTRAALPHLCRPRRRARAGSPTS